MCGFDSHRFQGIAQRACHSFTITEIAHGSICLATPFAMASAQREVMRFTTKKGAGGGCINPVELRATLLTVNPLNGRSWVYTPSSALCTDARPILSTLAISIRCV